MLLSTGFFLPFHCCFSVPCTALCLEAWRYEPSPLPLHSSRNSAGYTEQRERTLFSVSERMGNDWVVLVLISWAFSCTFPVGNGNSHCPVKQKNNTLPTPTPTCNELSFHETGRDPNQSPVLWQLIWTSG